jgi:membrane protein required for colicin V production
MNWLDISMLVILALFTVLGIYWGLIRQVLAIGGLIVGIIAAGRYGPEVAAWLTSFTNDDILTGWLGFIIVLIGVSAAASIIASILRVFVGLLFLGWVDHMLGGVLGFIQASLACITILALSTIYPLPGISQAIHESQLGSIFLAASSSIALLLPEHLQLILASALS